MPPTRSSPVSRRNSRTRSAPSRRTTTPIALASFTQASVGEATGAGIFAGMLVSDLLTEAGMVASKGGETGEVTKDFGKGGTGGDRAPGRTAS